MTTSVIVDVNGRYKATVRQSGQPDVEVHGRYDGSPNPGGQHRFNLPHPATGTFEITEEYLGEVPAAKVADGGARD